MKKLEVTKPKTQLRKQVTDVADEVEKIVDKTTDSMKQKQLYRSGKNKILGGVCGGIAEYVDIDPTIVRLFWVLLSLAWGTGILLYIIAWIIIPRNPNHTWT